MADSTTVTINSGTQEEVAFRLFDRLHLLALGDVKGPGRVQKALELYAECLKATRRSEFHWA